MRAESQKGKSGHSRKWDFLAETKKGAVGKMKEQTILLWEDGEYQYEGAFGFVPNLHTYLHEDGKRRPCMLVAPGGGYRMVSPTEGEIVAKCFYEKGYQAFVLTYTTNFADIAPLKMQPLHDISRAVRLIRANADSYGVDVDKIYACGFSAAGHLVGSLCVHAGDVEDGNEKYKGISNRLNAAILSYPVVTSGEFAHRDSFTALLGADASEEELTYFSNEKQVTEQTPPVFLWQTIPDETVPVENSILMAKALREHGIHFAIHLFETGRHGLSLANEEWAENGNAAGIYAMDQFFAIIKAVEEGKLELTEDKKMMLQFFQMPEEERAKYIPKGIPNESVAMWPHLADCWLRNLPE